MTTAAFDAKQFRRGRYLEGPGGKDRRFVGFDTQLGAGVVTDDPEKLARDVVSTSGDLMQSFGLDLGVPFVSSGLLRNSLEQHKAIAFADQLVTGVQDRVDSVHFSYVVLPPDSVPPIHVGGNPGLQISIGRFMSGLGPMFSYLTAHSYLWMSEYSTPDNLEVLLDVFNSKHTKAWDRLSGAVRPQIFSHGDECHPLIMLADMVAFLTDQKLYKQYLHLTPPNLDSIWREYDFSVTTLFFNQKSLPFYKWYDNDMIDLASYLAHPIVFLAIDDIEGDLGGDARPDAEIEYPANTPRKFNQAIKKSPVYDAAVTHAFRIGGCMKFYSRTEDVSVVRDGDVFVYVGDKSKMIGMTLQQGCRINVLSGVELRDLVEKGNH